jgi:DNA-binding CsgD family transcriptional regulator
MADLIVGRRAEIYMLDRFTDPRDIDQGCAVFVINGEPGIGKTTLWKNARDSARNLYANVLSAQAAAPEKKLPFTVLTDLFGDRLESLGAHLPPLLARSLDVALLREEAHGRSPEPRAVSVAGLEFLRLLAKEGPLLLAIDNLHLIDPSSYRVLCFALRRLTDRPIKILTSTKPGAGPADPFRLSGILTEDRCQQLALGPLSSDDLDDLLRDRLGLRLHRPTLMQLRDISEGNPFFAIEIGRALQRAGTRLPPGEQLPVPRSLEELLEERVKDLPERVTDLLLHVAALSQPTVELVKLALGTDALREIDRGVDAGLLEVKFGAIRFEHPLFRAALYQSSSITRRRQVHARLAGCVDEPAEKARQLALAAQGPDPAVAAALDDAASAVSNRGAPEIAAEFLELARALTPAQDSENLRRRTTEAANAYRLAGDVDRARELLQEQLDTSAAASERVELLLRLAEIADLREAETLYQRALSQAKTDEQRGRAQLGLSELKLRAGSVPDARDDAAAALATAELIEASDLIVPCLAQVAKLNMYAGEMDGGVLGRALQQEADAPGIPVHLAPSTIAARWLIWTGRLDEARRRLESQLETLSARGEFTARARLLEVLVELECRAGNLLDASRHATRQYRTASQTDDREVLGSRLSRALIASHRGAVNATEKVGQDVLRLSAGEGNVIFMIRAHALLGYVHLSAGDAEQAAQYFGEATTLVQKMGCDDPSIFPYSPDEIEARIALGDVVTATSFTDRLESQGEKLARPWALGGAARSRGLLISVQGDVEGGIRLLEQALQHYETMPSCQPLDWARTYMALGTLSRRAKQKRVAREYLEKAVSIFEKAGAALWRERAQAELARVGGRTSSPQELTPTEEQCAQLAAAGYSNKEIATSLFLSVKTVEANLTSVFRKTGISSRRQLRRLYASSSGRGMAPTE